ncbi:hypothetical protein TPHV1_200022 [Treponema phagedenis]|uniref:Uncharacterized protein n=1 Tax=Treponema phagedenis TaxID=162 RepID=A0A0B7GW03_TREPH|nr:hypothetical protein TPHV1_200022 [Treponema phagedenis]
MQYDTEKNSIQGAEKENIHKKMSIDILSGSVNREQLRD